MSSNLKLYQFPDVFIVTSGLQAVFGRQICNDAPKGFAYGLLALAFTYTGPALPADGTDANKYFWRMKVWDNNNNPSPWTNGNDYFMTPGNRVQDLSYAYDPVGNITHLADASFTKTAKVVDYTYDALNRLIQASTTPDISSGALNAGRHSLETWSYDALGNILTDTVNNGSSIATSTYQYQGNIGSNYADPDAATTIGTTTLSYDNSGNLTAGLIGFQGAWDWRNRLTTATSSSETDIYSYDENNKRVRVATPSLTYHYPNDLYEANSGSASVTKHIFLNGNDIAEIVGNTGSGAINYNFVDHLGSINSTADQNNRVQEITDYAPYGKPNNHDQINAYSALRKYIGQDYDNPTGFSYLNARYYDGSRGQFLSEDPVFWGEPKQQNLHDPQSLNVYSYSIDNPIVNKDPSGNCPWCLPFLIGGLGGGVSQYASDILANRAAGATGLAMYAPRSSLQEYNAAIATGAVAGAVGTAGLIYAGLAATVGSGVQDWAGGNNIDPVKALVMGITTVGTGGFFKWGAGASPAEAYMEATGRAFGNLPSSVFKNELRYTVSSEVFGSSASAIIQSRFQIVQSYNSNSGASTGRGGGAPSSNSLWVTPSGAVVSWGGQLVIGPVAQSTSAANSKK